MLNLHVTYTAKPGCRYDFVKELESSGCAPAVRKEPGCCRYDYFYADANEDDVLLIEVWEDEAAQQVHLTTETMAKIRAIKDKYILTTKLEKVK